MTGYARALVSVRRMRHVMVWHLAAWALALGSVAWASDAVGLQGIDSLLPGLTAPGALMVGAYFIGRGLSSLGEALGRLVSLWERMEIDARRFLADGIDVQHKHSGAVDVKGLGPETVSALETVSRRDPTPR